MHELSVAHDLLEMVREHAGPSTGAVTVHVRVGVLSGVVPAALASAFRAAIAGTDLRHARLAIEAVGLVVWCPQCEADRPLRATDALRCPRCGTRTPRVVGGLELELSRIEVADAAEDRRGPPADPQAE